MRMWNVMKHKEVLPLVGIVGLGCIGCISFISWQAWRNPDASFDRKNNPHPFQKIKQGENVKLIGIADYKKYAQERPKVPDEE